ncbi:MAG: VOC family protein [bacterium]
MGRVVHFEIHATEPEKLIEFYTALFDWKFIPAPFPNYWVIETGPADQPGINGGMVKRPCDAPAPRADINAYVCTVQVESLDDILQKSESLGSVLALPKMPVPGVGWLAYIKDTDGNILGLHQPDPLAQ